MFTKTYLSSDEDLLTRLSTCVYIIHTARLYGRLVARVTMASCNACPVNRANMPIDPRQRWERAPLLKSACGARVASGTRLAKFSGVL